MTATHLFMFFRDSTTGNPSFSDSDAGGGGFGSRTVLLTGVGA